jgi:tRNA(Ile)-lysidine synthase
MNHHKLAFNAERLLEILRSFPVANAYVVGFSGGADSTALLHALSAIQDQLESPVSAIHVNHGLHKHADLWQSQCETFCDQYNIGLVCHRVELKNNSGKGLEAEARHLRYAAMSADLAPGACLLTAHHADDQAETLLLNLMRGSGVDGLSAMPESRPLGNGMLQRPLLAFKTSALRDYLDEQEVKWTEDPSNQHLNHDRNFVRHGIIPLLEQRWPEVSKRLLLTRKAMTDARHLLENLAEAHLEQNLLHPFVLRLSSQFDDDPGLFKLVIRRWTKQSGICSIPAYRLDSFYEQVHHADSDNKVAVRWDGWSLRLYKRQLWLHKDRDIPPCPLVAWPSEQTELELGSDIGQLVLKQENDKGALPENPIEMKVPTPAFSIGSRIDIKDTGIKQGDQHKSLKNLFQQADIPPWFRDCIPLCQQEGELVAMGDWCFNESVTSWMSENNVKLSWHPRNPLLQFIQAQQQQRTGKIVDPAGAVR